MHVPPCPKCGVVYTFAQCGLKDHQPRSQVTICCTCGWQFRFTVQEKVKTNLLTRLLRRPHRTYTHTTRPYRVDRTERIGHGS